MASKSAKSRDNHRRRSATIQWLALLIAGALALIAAFVFFGDDSPPTLQNSPPVESVTQV